MIRTERRQRIQRVNGRTAGDREPGRLREGVKRGKGKRERDVGEQNHHRTVKIVNKKIRARV